VNLFGGGSFAVRHPLTGPIDLETHPVLNLWMSIPTSVMVSLHVRVNDRCLIHALTAPVRETYRVLGDPATEYGRVYPEWLPYVSEGLDNARICGEPAAGIEGMVRVNLLEEARRLFPGQPAYRLEGLIVGNSSHADYLMAGLGGNAAGSVYRIGAPAFSR